MGHTHTGGTESEFSMNPEELHPEVHFHPTHRHNMGEQEKHQMTGIVLL